MIVSIPAEVIPVWYIEKWKKENAENGSALDHFINQLIKDWCVEEARIRGISYGQLERHGFMELHK